MPISYSIDAEHHLIRTYASGVLTDDDLFKHKLALASDCRRLPGMRELADVRDVTDLQVTTRGVRELASIDAGQGADEKPHKLAIVTARDVVFGMARMYQTLTDRTHPGVSIFRDYDEAVAWLGLDAAARHGSAG